MELTSLDHSIMCIQCLLKKREGKCRMCGPHELYELDCELIFLCGALATGLQLLSSLDGRSSLSLRKVTTYVLATAGAKVAKKRGESKGGSLVTHSTPVIIR